MKPLGPFIEKIPKLTQSLSKDEPGFLKNVLETLVDAGFKAARYYEVTRDPARANHEVLVLRTYSHREKKIKLPTGISVPYGEATISAGVGRHDFVSSTLETSPQAAHWWIEKLHLEKDRWIDIPIRGMTGELVALIGLSLDLDMQVDIPLSHILYLTLKSSIEQFLWSVHARQILDARRKADEFVNTHKANPFVLAADVADLAARHFSRLIPAQVCAVFQYRWAERKLVKVAEVFSDSSSPAMSLPEEFNIGQNLTGGAWENSDLLRIPDYPSFIGQNPTLQRVETADFHQRTLGRVQSILHRRFGTGFLSFLVRVVNRKDAPELPFNYAHEMALASGCEQLGDFADDLSNRCAIRQLERMATSGSKKIVNKTAIIAECVSSLDELGFGNAVILHRPKGARFFDVLHNGDKKLHNALPRRVLDPAESKFLEKLSQPGVLKAWRLSDQPSSADDPFAGALRDIGVLSVISAGAGAEADGTIALRCIYAGGAQFPAGKTFFDGQSEEHAIPALLAIFSSAIDASHSMVSVDEAENLVAFFGHEVATPISKLGAKAIRSINETITLLRDNPQNMPQVMALQRYKAEVDRTSGQVTNQMRTAIALAGKSVGSIDVKFGKHKWEQLIDEAWQEALEWRAGEEGRSSARRVRLDKNAALAGLEVIGDANLLRGILANLLKNAIKYSLPRTHGDDPMVVSVRAIPQISLHIIQVENWGIGIPEGAFEQIFGRFARVARIDSRRSIRGMGLGLYISRLFAKVHNGELFCRESTPTLNDPERIDALEGFRTVFELRFPKGLRPGTNKVRFAE
ncbi:MAG TPA: sensor histidine kinase [Rhizomicrobium sp.]|nr:sensor histidine kinase [Rhizomicrobium sp.]